MAWVFANYVNLAMTSNDFALIAHFLNRRTYLHNLVLSESVDLLYFNAQPQAIIPNITMRVFAYCKMQAARCELQNAKCKMRILRRLVYTQWIVQRALVKLFPRKILLVAVGDSAAVKIIWRKFNFNFVSW